MCGRQFRLFLFSIMIFSSVLYSGCGQPEDIIAPVSTTDIYLSPAQLPSAPSGYVYELWATDTSGESYSMGKFLWDSYHYHFMDADSNIIDSVWTVDFDVLDPFYRYLDVSVEPYPDPNPDIQGAVLLRDTLGDPEVNPIQMVFPIDFGLSTGGYAIETPTDKDSRSYDASGVWFALYTFDSMAVHDTINVFLSISTTDGRRLEIETIYWMCIQEDEGVCIDSSNITAEVLLDPDYMLAERWEIIDTTNLEELANTLDTVAVICIDTLIDSLYVLDPLALDTFVHVTTEFEFIALPVNVGTETFDTVIIDPCSSDTIELSIRPFTDYIHQLFYTTRQNAKYLDRFLSNYEEMPDLAESKWHYKGWIISPYLPTDCNELGRMTKPEWSDFIVNQYFEQPDDWAIISTGSFKNWDNADDANLYSDTKRVPDFPGEDFIMSLPCGRTDPYIFADSANRNYGVGDIFVTLEPDGYDANTNFPLILFTTRTQLPPYSAVSDTTIDHVQTETLLNVAERVNENPFGFPGINVDIKRK